jgi:hypothetical protein
METFAFQMLMAATAIAAVIWLGRVALVRWRYARLKERPVLIGVAMDLYGITPKDAEDAGLGPELRRAAERCAKCGSTGECHGWLAAGSRSSLDDSCPNARYFQEVARYRGVRELDSATGSIGPGGGIGSVDVPGRGVGTERTWWRTCWVLPPGG